MFSKAPYIASNLDLTNFRQRRANKSGADLTEGISPSTASGTEQKQEFTLPGVTLGVTYANSISLSTARMNDLKSSIAASWKVIQDQTLDGEAAKRVFGVISKMVNVKVVDGHSMVEIVDIFDFVQLLEALTAAVISQNEVIEQMKEQLRTNTSKLADMEMAALLRQIAINVEYEKKMKCWGLMTKDSQKKFVSRRTGYIDESIVKATPLSQFENDVPEDKWKAYIDFYDAVEFYHSPPTYNRTTVITDATAYFEERKFRFCSPYEGPWESRYL